MEFLFTLEPDDFAFISTLSFLIALLMMPDLNSSLFSHFALFILFRVPFCQLLRL